MTNLGHRVDVRRADELSAREFYALLKLRVDVFVVEQKCPYPELDGKDMDALHLRMLAADELVAAARILPPLHAGAPARIGRVVVAPHQRGMRLGETLMREAIAACERLYPGTPIGLSAQAHLAGFYESLGFSPTSELYLEDDIPHIDMVRPPATRGA